MELDDIVISYNNYDIIFKSLTNMFSSQSLEFYGLKTAPIMRAEPADLPQIKIDERRMDFVFYLVDDTYLHIEFQTTFKKEDLDRFKLYDALLYEEKKKPVYTAIIYGAGIDDSPTELNYGSLKYIVQAVYMGKYDGDNIYSELKEKINQSGTLSSIDKLNLIFLPLMKNSVDKSQRAIDAIEIAQNITDKKEQLFLIGCLIGISDKFIDEAYVQKMMEVMKMTRVLQRLYKEFKEEGRIEGKAEGISSGKQEDVIKLLKKKFKTLPEPLADKIKSINSVEKLEEILLSILDISSLDEVEKMI